MKIETAEKNRLSNLLFEKHMTSVSKKNILQT